MALKAETPAPPEAASSPSRDPRVREDPHWLHEALTLPVVHKVRMMGAALWFSLRAPRAFGEAWYCGEGNIPNPLVAMAASVSILTVLGQEVRRLTRAEDSPHSLLASFIETLGPYVVYITVGLVAHGALRLFGSQRKLRTTVGVTLLTGAGAGTILAIGVTLPTLIAIKLFGMPSSIVSGGLPSAAKAAVIVVFTLLYFYFLAVFELALAGAHGLPRWKGVVAGTFAVFIVAYVCGALEHTGHASALGALGPHLSVYFDGHGLHQLDFMW